MNRDKTTAVALEIAERNLNKMGFRFGATNLGYYAAEIILAMDAKLKEQGESE